MKLFVFAAAGLFALFLLWMWLTTLIHYRIGSKHLKIVLLGVVVRKIDLKDIKRISKRRPRGPAEYWYSTFNTSHRVLTIQRYGGLRKNVAITPRNRYIFLADLQSAVKRAKPDANIENLIEPAAEESDPQTTPG